MVTKKPNRTCARYNNNNNDNDVDDGGGADERRLNVQHSEFNDITTSNKRHNLCAALASATTTATTA